MSKNGFSAAETVYDSVTSPDGGAVSYMALGAFSGAQSASFPDAYVSRRGADGWETTNVSPPTPDATPPGGDGVAYNFSEDLSKMVTGLPLQQLAPGATPEVNNLFMSPTTVPRTYSWINDVKPHLLLPEGCPSPENLADCWQFVDRVAFAGASPDFRHVLFESTESLAGGAPEERENLYESAYEGGKWHVSFVGILPDGSAASEGSTAGSGSHIEFDNRVANAISGDGSRVVFQAAADAGGPDPAQAGLTEVFDRLNGNETVELSAPVAGAKPVNTSSQSAQFWGASADGNRVFFTSLAELTTQSYTGTETPICEEGHIVGCGDHGDLYEYNVETKTLKDLTVDANLPADVEEGAAVQGVVGASSDGSYVYFVAKGQLVPGKGKDHEDNLYMAHNGNLTYIASPSESDGNNWTEFAAFQESYVTPDGKHLAFTSINSLPTVNFAGGYDNVNAGTGNPEREVYQYSAPTSEEEGKGLTGNLICVSCDPSGVPPIGSGLVGGTDREEPGSEGFSVSTPFQHVRAVSDNGGRVFFSSPDPLVPAVESNKNTQAKLYEYEQDGEGGCEKAAGCIYLLSSPSSPQATAFLGADAEGDNVFFDTISGLTSSDRDGLVDVYDARVGGGIPLSGEERCQSACRPAPTGSGSEAGLPSAAVGSSGNLAGSSPGAVSKKAAQETAAQIRAQRLKAALRACHKQRNGRRRRSCEAQARKRYGPHGKAKKSSHGKGRGR